MFELAGPYLGDVDVRGWLVNRFDLRVLLQLLRQIQILILVSNVLQSCRTWAVGSRDQIDVFRLLELEVCKVLEVSV